MAPGNPAWILWSIATFFEPVYIHRKTVLIVVIISVIIIYSERIYSVFRAGVSIHRKNVNHRDLFMSHLVIGSLYRVWLSRLYFHFILRKFVIQSARVSIPNLSIPPAVK